MYWNANCCLPSSSPGKHADNFAPDGGQPLRKRKTFQLEAETADLVNRPLDQVVPVFCNVTDLDILLKNEE
jgi:hypothetical protein